MTEFWCLIRKAVLCTLPFVFLLSALLLISNIVTDISLIRNGRASAVNIQGLLSAAVLCTGCSLIIFAERLSLPVRSTAVHIAGLVFLLMECILFSAIAVLRATERRSCPKDRDFLIILGCGLYPDGKPTTMLKNRMRAGLVFYKEQLEKTGNAPLFVASGGQGPDEIRPEANAMKEWLMDQGVPEKHILTENRSRTTGENMSFSNVIITAAKPNAKTAFCTTNFHAFRAGIKAGKVGLEAEAITYNTEWYYWYNAAIREIAGLFIEEIFKEAYYKCTIRADRC